jgi:hypothetical protein
VVAVESRAPSEQRQPEVRGGEEEEFRNSGSLATVAAYAYFELRLLLLLATSYRPGWRLVAREESRKEKRGEEESAGDGVVEESSFFAAAEGAGNAVEE